MELTFALRVFEQADAAGMRVRPGAAGVIGPFDDEQATVLVKRHRDRGGDHRLGGDQFEAKARLDAKGSRRIRGWRRRDAGHGIGRRASIRLTSRRTRAGRRPRRPERQSSAVSHAIRVRVAHASNFVQFRRAGKGKHLELRPA